MFPESSTWRADVVRVTADGRRVPDRGPVGGLPLGRARPGPRAALPGGPPPRRRRARQPAGVPRGRARLGRRQHPARPRDALPRGHGHVLAQRRPAANRVVRSEVREERVSAAEPLGRARRAARAPGQHARARAAADASPARSCSCTCGRSSPTAWTGGSTATPSTSPTPPGTRSCPGPSTSGCSGSAAVAAVAMSLGLLTRVATATTFAIVTYNLFLSTTHFHNNRAYLVIVLGAAGAGAVRPRAVARRVAAPPPRAAAARPAAPAWPLWLLRFECAAVYGASGLQQARRPRLVRRHRHLAARRARARTSWRRGAAGLGGLAAHRPQLPHRRGQAHRAHRAVHRARPLVARHSLRGRVGRRRVPRRRSRCSASVQVFSFLGIAVLVIWAVPSTRDRVLRIDPTRDGASGAWPRSSAGSTGSRASGRAGSAGLGAAARRPRRHHAPRRAGRRVRAQPAARSPPGSRCRRCSSRPSAARRAASRR